MLRSQPGFLRNPVPFISAGVGVACPVRTFNSETEMEINLSFSGSIGVDYFIYEDILIRLSGEWMTILQNEIWFNSISVNLGAVYCF